MRRKTSGMASGKPGLPKDINAALRARQALELVIQGHDYTSIAAQVGYSSRSAAWTAVHRELARQLKPPTEEVRQLEVMRLDALLVVYMKKALGGDGWSCDRVLRISEARRKLLGLDYGPLTHPSDQQAAQFIMIELPKEVIDAV